MWFHVMKSSLQIRFEDDEIQQAHYSDSIIIQTSVGYEILHTLLTFVESKGTIVTKLVYYRSLVIFHITGAQL
jgi:hypothetical protein